MRFPFALAGSSFLKNFSTKSTAKKPIPSELRVINSHEAAESPETARLANEKRIKEIKVYQRELARSRRSHAAYAQSIPTKSKIEGDLKANRSQKRSESWSRYVDGLKRCWNPPVQELQATGKIPKRDEAKRAEKSRRGQENLMKSLKQSILMKRKYLNYMGTELVPNLVTHANLDAKIQEAVDPTDPEKMRPTNNYNLPAETVVEIEKNVKKKLKEIRVPMNEFA